MDTRDTPEQEELRRAARRLAHDRAAGTVADLDDSARARRLADAVRDAGWLELRDDGGHGTPLAGGVEAAIVADALGGAVADVAFTGPLLVRDLLRRAGLGTRDDVVVACSADLSGPATDAEARTAYAVDAGRAKGALVLVARAGGHGLAVVPLDGVSTGSDLTRTVVRAAPHGAVRALDGQRRVLTDDDLRQWTALGLALTSADLVGVMRGVLDLTVAYAIERRQYGLPIGSFQAVQHLLAEARCLMEGSLSVSLHAAWAVDALEPVDAVAAGRVAKAYCARAARTVCETAVQVHGGIGNTWECMVHVSLRRALLSSQWFGDDGVQLAALQHDRLEGDRGLS